MRKGKNFGAVLLGYLLLFLTVTVIISVATLIYSAATASLGGNRGGIAIIMLTTILFLSLLCMGIDAIRRRATVERPVNKILDATRRIAAGDFSVRLEIAHSYKRYDDYDCIMENLNKMAAELSKTEVLRNDFISNVSHELKTPLAVIQNYATSIQNPALDAETRRQYAKTLVATSRRLTDLIVNILKLNKLDNQEIQSDFEQIRLDEQLAQSVLQYEELIDGKQLRLDCDIEENVTVFSSPNYLELVWNNLLSNAVKFTEAGGRIGVSLKRRAGKAVVQISDSGCGISRETGAQIFERFFQGDTSHAQEGNGLGLALVKRVIDIIGGEISVESELGKGSTFTVVLREGHHEKAE